MGDIIKEYDISRLPERLKNLRLQRKMEYDNSQKELRKATKLFEQTQNRIKKDTQTLKFGKDKDSAKAEKKIEKLQADLDNSLKLLNDAKRYSEKYSKYECCSSQDTLANSISVSRKTLIEWEKGRKYPELSNLIKLCSILDCNLDYFVGSLDAPATETVALAHFYSGISSSIIQYGIEHEDYLDCLNFFMHPDRCKSLFNDITISTWREFTINSALEGIKSPFKEELIEAYDEYIAITPIYEVTKESYKSFLENKFPQNKLIVLGKEATQNGYKIKGIINPLIYYSFFDDDNYDYSKFINYLVKASFDALSQMALIEKQKQKLSQKFIELFEEYISE